MAFYENQRTKYDIPLSHLDHKYIPQCKDVKELEKILKVLRSGTEGTFPDLEKLTEDQIRQFDPDNKLLRKSGKPLLPGQLDEEERKELEEYIECWVEEAKEKENLLNKSAQDIVDELPPVRNAAPKIPTDESEEKKANDQKSSQKRVKPRDYREWDKFDVDAELNKAEERNGNSSEGTKATKEKSHLPESISGSGLSEELKRTKADYERNKGNEAFKAGDFDEAIVYYCRSISLLPTAAAFNNRALVYLRQKKWNKALEDCNAVLAIEPNNLKAILRRASAYQGLTRYPQAKKDLETVLAKEPNNKHAVSILKEVDKALADQKVTGRRMKIEEIEESDPEKTPSGGQEAKQNIPEKVENLATVENKKPGTEKTVTEDTLQNHEEKNKEHFEDARKSPEKDKPSTGKDDTGRGMGEPDATRENEKDAAKSVASETAASAEISVPVGAEVASQSNSDVSAPNSEISSTAPPPPLEKNVLALKDAGNELFRKGQYSDAFHKYDLAIKKIPDGEKWRNALNVSVLYSNRAACKLKIGDCRGCVEDCDEAIKYFPNSPKPYLRRAMAYEQMERFQEAFVDYKQALNAGINSDVAQQGSDRCASMLQQVNGPRWREKLPKIASFSSLAGLVPPTAAASAAVTVSDTSAEDAKVLFEKQKTEGNKLFAKGEYSKAIDCFSKCIELFSDHVVPYTNRALCYLKLGKCDDVLNDCNQALSIEFHNVKALYRRALAYKMQEKYEESLIDLETILKLDPNNSAAKKELQHVTQCREEMQEKKAQFACLREQQKLRQRIKIQEVESSSEDEEEKGKSSSPSKVNPPQSRTPAEGTHTSQKRQSEPRGDPCLGSKSASLKLPKVTPYAFLQAWKSLKFTEDIDSYATLLDQVHPQELSKVISSSLDGEFLLNLVRCTKSFIKNGRAMRALDYLHQLVKVPRFDMVMMFMSESDKSEIGNIFDLLRECSSEGISSDLLAQTRNKYNV